MRAQGAAESLKTGEPVVFETGEQEKTGEPLDDGFKTGEQETAGGQETGMQTGAGIDTVTGNPEVVLPPDSETDEPLPYLGDEEEKREETGQTGQTSTSEESDDGRCPSVEALVKEAFEKGRKAGREESRRQAETDCAAAYLRGRNEAIENKIRRENKVQLNNDAAADNEPGIEAIFKFRSHVW